MSFNLFHEFLVPPSVVLQEETQFQQCRDKELNSSDPKDDTAGARRQDSGGAWNQQVMTQWKVHIKKSFFHQLRIEILISTQSSCFRQNTIWMILSSNKWSNHRLHLKLQERHIVGCLHKHGAHICLQDQHRSIVGLDFPPHLALTGAFLLVRILQPEPKKQHKPFIYL
jgi:hypothetical protein